MGKGPRIAFAAVMTLFALVAIGFMVAKREVIASTPSAYTGPYQALALPAGSQACADQIAYDRHSQVARFGVTAKPGTKGPELEVTATGDPGYRAIARVPGGWTGTKTFDIPIATPPRGGDAYGEFCIRNPSRLDVDLVGSVDGRAYSRPTVSVDGHAIQTELVLRFVEREQRSLLARLGETSGHAATLQPLGAWWFWLLGIVLALAVPFGLWRAVQGALESDVAAGAVRDIAREPWPPRWTRRAAARVTALPAWSVLAVAGALIVLWLLYWSLDTNVFQNDEDQYVYLSRWLQTDFPASLFDFAAYGRGLQRLEVWLLAIPSALVDSPWSLRGGRILNTIAFVSTAIPVFLLARGLRLRPLWAVLPALLAVMVPWAVVTTGFLTENVAYPACWWAIWAIWRTAIAGGVRNDVLALVLLVVAGAARSGLLLLVPVLPIVVAGTVLRCAPGSLTARGRALLREHWLLAAAVAVGVLVLVADGLGLPGADGIGQRLAGGYQTVLGFNVGHMLEKMCGYLSKVVVGTGFFPAAIALPWLVTQLWRSGERERFAFALVAFVTTLALLYSLNAAGPDERYVLYLAPFVLVPAAVAVARREVTPAGLAIASVLLGILLWRVPWSADQGPFGYFVSPVEMFYTHALGERLDRNVPGGPEAALDLVAFLFMGAGVALAAVLARRRRWLTPGWVGIIVFAVALLVPLQAQYALSKYVNGAGSKAAPSDRARAFVDTTVPAGKTVGELAEGVGQLPSFFSAWQEVQFYTQKLDRVYSLGDNVNPVPPGDQLVEGVGFDAETGRVSAPRPLPDYLAIPTQVGKARVRGEIVASLSYLPVALIKVAKPDVLDWSADGFDPVGNVADAATVRFYGTGRKPGSYCGSYALIAPPDKPMAWQFEVAGEPLRSGSVAAGASTTVNVSLPDLARKEHVDVKISGDGVRVAGIGVGSGC
jgi:hypothetical protein